MLKNEVNENKNTRNLTVSPENKTQLQEFEQHNLSFWRFPSFLNAPLLRENMTPTFSSWLK